MQFTEYLATLSPEGETALIVKQIRKGDKGDIWMPHLPGKRRGEAAWYGNTGSFHLARMKDGKLSASASNCTHCLCMVLDDIGSKAKEPPLPPTWRMETSPGNFQWGYVFSEQPTTGEFSAAIKAIAAAGYTDPGATNPVRNFRLPGSINLKPGRNNFASLLTEFEPTREYTIEAICAALGVTPGAADTAKLPRLDLPDDGKDDVLAWLAKEGHLHSHPNSSGWCDVTCPNAAAHTTGAMEGRYYPANRAFRCMHGHCETVDSAAFLTWVAAEGGPKHDPGVRAELLVAAMQTVADKLGPKEFFSDDAAAVIAEVDRREAGRVEKKDWYTRFAYVQADDAFFDMQERREYSRATFNAIFRHVSCLSVHNGRRIEAGVCFDETRQDQGARTLEGITYAAGDSVLVSRNGDVYGNRWRDARPTPGTGDITPWLAHCEKLIPEAAEREHVFDVMAFKVQNPKIKINHAVLHGGDQGCGKDTLWAPFIWSVCGPGLVNRGLMDNQSLTSQWGYQLESEILIINELREPEARERRALANRLKPIIAAPPEMLPINRKGLHPYDMANRMFVLAFSNDPIPISLDSMDRRWFCVWSAAQRMDPEAARVLWNWYRAEGFAAIAGWMHRRDVSAFNPAAAPAWTEFKSNMVEHGMSIAESFLVDLMRNRKGEFAKGIIGGPFHMLCDRLSAAAPAGTKIPQVALLHSFKEAGWVDMGRLGAVDMGTKRHVFCAPNMVNSMTKSDMRRAVEEMAPTPPRMTIVK